MSRPSQTESVYVQTLPDGKCLCPDFRALKIFRAFIVRSKVLMSRPSCVQSCICPDYRAFKVTYVQTIVRSKLHMSRPSCVQNCICPDYRAFKFAYLQTIVRSKLHMSRISCVHFFPGRVILNARRHLVRSFRYGHIDFRSGTSTWVLAKLGNIRGKLQPRLRCQTESRYVQTIPDGKCLCPDPPRQKVPMSKLSCVQNFSCVHRAFKTPYVQTFVRSKSYTTRL